MFCGDHRDPFDKSQTLMFYHHELVAVITLISFTHTHSSGLLEDMSFKTHLHTWFHNNGAPPHYSHEVCQWLSKNYPECWIGCGHEAPVFQFPDLHTHLT
jgi:hypothetical protein